MHCRTGGQSYRAHGGQLIRRPRRALSAVLHSELLLVIYAGSGAAVPAHFIEAATVLCVYAAVYTRVGSKGEVVPIMLL